MNILKFSFALCLGLMLATTGQPAFATTTDSPVGLWKTIDDQNGAPRAVIRIVQVGEEYQGVLEKLLRPTDPEAPVCDKCPGQRKGQPLLGMAIVTGMKRVSTTEYGGGEILDPNIGKTYLCKMTLKDGGIKLDVRGFVGVSLFGRTQTWLRVE